MIRPPRAIPAALALLACWGTALSASRAEAGAIAPFGVAIAVRWGSGAGSDAFREDLSRSLAANLAARCFARVAIADGEPGDADVALTVVLSEVVDETRFDDTIAGALQPGDPGQELRRVARFQVTVDATLSTPSNGALLHRKHLVADVSRRPLYLGEDPQATARGDAIDRIVRDLEKSLGCGRPKLARKISDALGAAGAPAAAPRCPSATPVLLSRGAGAGAAARATPRRRFLR